MNAHCFTFPWPKHRTNNQNCWPAKKSPACLQSVGTPCIACCCKPFTPRDCGCPRPAPCAWATLTATLTACACAWSVACLLYTSDAADDLLCVDLGGRR